MSLLKCYVLRYFTNDEEAFPLIIRRSRHDKIYFVTGGVVSSLGKGITASSLGRLLKDRGLNVTIQNSIHT